MESGSDINPIENIELIEPAAQKKKKKPRNPSMALQMGTLIDRLDQQAARTDRLIDAIDARMHRTPPEPTTKPHKVVEHSLTCSPGSGGQRSKKKIVYGSRAKKRSPRTGTKPRNRNSTFQSDIVWSQSSSDSESNSTQAQVQAAMGMLNPRFTKHTGNTGKHDERVQRYRPFAYLDRERQRDIVRHSHPDELTLNQHLGGLCAMATEELDPNNPAMGIVQHIAQLLEDIEFIPWQNVRAFSNTVITNIAKSRWWWGQDTRIEQCRTNQYMRYKVSEEPQWSVPCPAYNKGRCNYEHSHSIGEVYMKHFCAYCSVFAQESSHTSRACNKKKFGNQLGQASTSYDRREPRQSRAYNKGDRPEDQPKN